MNKTILMGRLTKEPELKVLGGSNTSVCKFTLAVPRKYKQTGQPEVDFLNIVAFSKTAEFCANYYRKGQQVLVVGRVQNRSWDDADGTKHYATEVIIDEAEFADTKKPQEDKGDAFEGDIPNDEGLPF